MKVKLFEDFYNEGIELTIRTNAERNILIDCLLGGRFKQIIVDGCNFIRQADSTIDEAVILYMTDYNSVENIIKIPMIELEAQLKELKLAELDYNDAGEYTAEAYDGTFHTTILLDDNINHAVILPADPTEENLTDPAMCQVSGIGLNKGMGAKIVSQGLDEAANFVYNYRIRVNDMDKDLMYELDMENLCDSLVYQL